MKSLLSLSFRPVLPAILLAPLMIPSPANAAMKKGSQEFSWENSIIEIEVTSKSYDYIQPWVRSENKVYKDGVVVEGHQIITTADGLADQTLIRLKKQGAGLFSLGTIVWIDYQANLAAITTDEKDFWTGLQPVKLADPTPISGDVRIQRWENDSLENHQGEVESLLVDTSALSFVSVPVLKIDSTIPGAGYSEAVTTGDKLAGLTSEADGDTVMAVPSSFISSILKARAAKTYTGLGYFDFTWDPVQNPLCLDYLKLPGPARGVIVKDTGLKPGLPSVVKPRDVILQIDGFDIDADGNYIDPDYKKLCLENLSSRGKWAASDCKFKIWRNGKEMNITYKLPKAEFSDDLVPNQSFDQTPEYVLAGGFVFVPLTNAYLRSWGPEWRQRSPFRLFYYNMDKVTTAHPQRVVLSQVLPDEVNIGYEGLRNTVVDEINGIKIKQISDVVTALKSPVNGYDVFKFVPGQPVQQAVLDASILEDANQGIMARYHIPADHVLNSAIVQDGATTVAPVAKK
ncbi:MAG TPA: hypothetical protein VL981_06650 [Candidatus Methylacidiphilales bacterium]|nr:hypothetical protein [Candidatus Methylacidiphilales bacterium]